MTAVTRLAATFMRRAIWDAFQPASRASVRMRTRSSRVKAGGCGARGFRCPGGVGGRGRGAQKGGERGREGWEAAAGWEVVPWAEAEGSWWCCEVEAAWCAVGMGSSDSITFVVASFVAGAGGGDVEVDSLDFSDSVDFGARGALAGVVLHCQGFRMWHSYHLGQQDGTQLLEF